MGRTIPSPQESSSRLEGLSTSVTRLATALLNSSPNPVLILALHSTHTSVQTVQSSTTSQSSPDSQYAITKEPYQYTTHAALPPRLLQTAWEDTFPSATSACASPLPSLSPGDPNLERWARNNDTVMAFARPRPRYGSSTCKLARLPSMAMNAHATSFPVLLS